MKAIFRKTGLLLALTGIVLLAACGKTGDTASDSTTPNDAQTGAVMSTTSAMTSAAGNSVYTPTTLMQNEVESFLGASQTIMIASAGTVAVDRTTNCASGGTLHATGNAGYTAITGTTSAVNVLVGVTLSTDFANCKVAASDGKIYTITGTLAIAGGSGHYIVNQSGSGLSSTISVNGTYELPITGTIGVAGTSLAVTNCAIATLNSVSSAGNILPTNTMAHAISWSGTTCAGTTSGTASGFGL